MHGKEALSPYMTKYVFILPLCLIVWLDTDFLAESNFSSNFWIYFSIIISPAFPVAREKSDTV